MACYRCAEQFRFFKKEIGCGNCGFSFCSKCCNLKINVPKKDNKLLSVCQNCHHLLKNEANKTKIDKDISPPKNFLKMVESNVAKSQNSQLNPVSSLEKRLENLNNSSNEKLIPAQDATELEARLNKLQGRNEQYQNLSNLPSKETIKTPEDLISKLTQEVTLDKDYEEFEKRELEKLENRLKNLRSAENKVANLDKLETGNESEKQKSVESMPKKSLDPAEELMKKMLLDAELILKKNQIQEEEETWCCICNGDSNLRCIDCENDYYCNRCFKQTHSANEYKKHRKTDL